MPSTATMAPKPAQDKVRHLRREGRTEAEIRARLKEEGYKPGRISQLLKLTRVEEIQEAGQGWLNFSVTFASVQFVCTPRTENRKKACLATGTGCSSARSSIVCRKLGH